MVFTFWEGVMPSYIKLCLGTWKIPFTVLNYDNLSRYTDLPIDKLKQYSLAQISDVVRVHVLRDNGGYWIDADTIMLKDSLPEYTILGDNESRINTCGYLHTEANNKMFIEWAKYQDAIIDSDNISTYWALMANAFSDNYLKQHKDIEIGDITNHWAEVYMLLDNRDRYQKYVDFYFNKNYKLADLRKTDILMLHNSWTPAWYKKMLCVDVLSHNCTLSNILKEIA